MTPATLEIELRSFAAHLLSPLLEEGKSPIIKHQTIKERPLTVRLGMRVTGTDPEHVQALASNGKAVTEAWLKQWPLNTPGLRDPKSVSIASDDKHVIMDVVFFTLELDTPDSLTPAQA
jgi:hypothetical protein